MEITGATVGGTAGLEIALLRRKLGEADTRTERCHRCHRGILIGERVYEYESGAMLCALCRDVVHPEPIGSHRVHGPAFGHSIRVVDQRVARVA
ncbi:MAG: hypothetical protein ACRDKL_09425 [Solirubrobacteraceae bacterium]